MTIHRKKREAALVICILAVGLFCWSACAAPIKVFILSGQSNMVGFGKINDFCSGCPLGTIEQNTFSKIAWYVAVDNDTSITFIDPLAPGNPRQFSGFTTFGPEIGIAKKLSVKYPGEQLIFVKVAWGGKNLQENWINNAAGVYTWFKTRVKDALNDIPTRPKFASGYTIAGMIWIQGESDGLDASMAKTYAAHLATFVNTIRTDSYLGFPSSLPFVYGKIQNAKRWAYSPDHVLENAKWIPYGLNVQVGQYRAQTIPCVRCTDGSSSANATVWNSESSDNPFNKWHYDSQGVTNVGLALGQAMVELLEGKTKPWGCSNPSSKVWAQSLINN
jgi:hypothetical protein